MLIVTKLLLVVTLFLFDHFLSDLSVDNHDE